MPRQVKPLSDAEIKNAKAKAKPYKLFDGGGLYLEIGKNGSKHWYLKYYRPSDGKENRLALGPYPLIRLPEARDARLKAKQQLKQRIDPKNALGKPGGGNTFAAIAEERTKIVEQTLSETHVESIRSKLRIHILPWIGDKPIDSIMPTDMIEIARRIEAKGHRETAHRVIGVASQVFDYAIETGRAKDNPASAIRKSLLPVIHEHFAAIKKPDEVGKFLISIDHYHGNPTTVFALKLSAYLFLRPGEIRQLKWENVDFEKRELHLPIEIMKTRYIKKLASPGKIAHIVPLSRQAFALLKDLHKLNGDTPFLFPQVNRRQERCMSDGTVLNAIRTMGYEKGVMTAHGFRHLASTNLYESLECNSQFIEKQLSHDDRNRVRAAYNHAEYVEQRHDLMQAFADWLDEQKEKAKQALRANKEAP